MAAGAAPGALPLLTAAEMRAWDAAARAAGVPQAALMEAAGRSAAAVLWALVRPRRVVAVLGPGHNGGDAAVALRCLVAWGAQGAAVPVGRGRANLSWLAGWPVDVREPEDLERVLARADWVLDGLLGTGAEGPPRGPAADVVQALVRWGGPVLALDGPSGVDLTSGAAPGPTVRAEVTVTFGAPKRGLILFPGRAFAGRLLVVDIGLPPTDAAAWLITPAWARATLPPVPPGAHKGTMGTVLVVAGSAGMAGAAAWAALGALRGGAGKVVIATSEANRPILQTLVPEAIVVDRDGPTFEAALAAADAIVAGPGMGTDAAAEAVLAAVLGCPHPRVLDADALTLLARRGFHEPLPHADRTLLTPHPGEAGRILQRSAADVAADPFAAAAALTARTGAAVLLKGPPSLVAAPAAPTLVSVAGHSGIATGGMGDLLAGLAGALLAQRLDPQRAGAVALALSGRAAELAGRGRALLPRDVAEALGAALLAPDPNPLALPGVLLDLPAWA